MYLSIFTLSKIVFTLDFKRKNQSFSPISAINDITPYQVDLLPS